MWRFRTAMANEHASTTWRWLRPNSTSLARLRTCWGGFRSASAGLFSFFGHPGRFRSSAIVLAPFRLRC